MSEKPEKSQKPKKSKKSKNPLLSISLTTYIRIGIALVTFLLVYMNLDAIFGLVRGTKSIQDTSPTVERQRDRGYNNRYSNDPIYDPRTERERPRNETQRPEFDRGRLEGNRGDFAKNDPYYDREIREEQPIRSSRATEPERDKNRTRTNYAAKTKNNGVSILSWNLQELGKSKNEEERNFIVNILRHFDVVAIQEVVTSFYGAQAVVSLAEDLNRTGADWRYAVSESTTGRGSERYAYLWKTSKVKLAEAPMLSKRLEADVDREPYLVKFETQDAKKNDFILVNFHAVPENREPAYEIYQLKYIEEAFPNDNIIYMGDFNLSEKHEVFNVLYRRNYEPVFSNLKTTLKRKAVNGVYHSNAFDNIFFNTKEIGIKDAGAIDFVQDFRSLEEARQISDHLPVWAKLIFK